MIRPQEKVCDICGKVVAEKWCFSYLTLNKYYTIDCASLNYLCDYNTKNTKEHFCEDCWKKMLAAMKSIEKKSLNKKTSDDTLIGWDPR